MNDFVRKIAGDPITNNRCARPPFGCGKPITTFKDELSRKEYSISGLCQSCQDAFFDEDEQPEPYFDDREQFELNQLALDNE